jgi:hypothetical protein
MMQRLQSICEVYDFIDMKEQLFHFMMILSGRKEHDHQK